MQQGEEAGEKCEAWEEAAEVWNDLTVGQRRRCPDLRPDESAQPSEGEIELWHFWQGVKRAEAFAENEAISVIKTAAREGTWQASAWWLERKHRARWARQDKVTHEGRVDHSHQLLPQSPQQIEEAQRRLAEARALHSGSEAPELPSPASSNGLEAALDSPEAVIEAEAVEIEEE